MNKFILISLCGILISFTACNSLEKTSLSEIETIDSLSAFEDTVAIRERLPNELIWLGNLKESESEPALEIKGYINRVFQDKTGIFWIGTYGMGVIRYDPNAETNGADAVKYFSTEQGLDGKIVREIVEDKAGNIWFGSEAGIAQYDPATESFTNYTEKEGLANNDVWSLAIDRTGIVWIGTLEGVSRFDANGSRTFSAFALPEATPDTTRKITSAKMVHHIMEDSQGKLWFGTNGGAYIYDPAQESLNNLSEKDGLCDNAVNRIMEDRNGNFWFATQHQGVCRLNRSAESMGKISFTQMTTKTGFEGKNIALDVFEDATGDIWFPIEGVGTHRYDGQTITNFFESQTCVSHTVRNTMEDEQGRLWFASWLGVFRYEPTAE